MIKSAVSRSAGVFTIAIAVIITVTLASCSPKPPRWKQQKFTELDMNRELSQKTLPRGLWQKIVSVLDTGTAAAHGAKEESKQGPLPSVFAPLRVYFIEKNKGILVRGNTVVEFPAGGGELDLTDLIRAKNGSFYLAVDFLPDDEGIKRKVFFLSGGVQRRIAGEVFGAGCDTYFDVSNAFAHAMKGEGFLLNTNDGRHVSALAGTYFFAAAKSGKLHLAALTIKDSSHKSTQCPSI